jgi:hypothetical protein
MSEEQEMSASELAAYRIKTMPLDKEYKPVPDLPIPLGWGVLIRPVKVSSIVELEGSGLLLSLDSKKNEDVCVGILYALGSKCGPELRVGIRVGYTKNANERFWHRGVDYIKTDEMGVLYAIPDPETTMQSALIDDKNAGRKDRMERQIYAEKVTQQKWENEKDQKEEKKKSKKVHKI